MCDKNPPSAEFSKGGFLLPILALLVSRYGLSLALSNLRISSISAWRPSFFFENKSSPLSENSNAPPREGISVQEAM